MLIICCPVCGVAGDEEEFHYGGEGHIRRPASHDPERVSDEEQRDYLYMRENPRGLLRERWQHRRGCGKWFHAVRDTLSQEILLVYPITDPPPDLDGLQAGRAGGQAP